jgi:putative ABC transport system permease protein
VDELLQGIRQALRSARKTPVVTITTVLTLALVIGVNTSIFSVIDSILLKPLPYPNGDRIVTLWERKPNGQPNSMTTLNYLDYAAEASVFEKVAATTTCCGYMTLTEGGTPAMIVAEHVSAPYFDIFDIRAALGRTFLHGDDQEGRDHVLVMSHALWASRFGADPGLVGHAIHLDGDAYTVIGILPESTASGRSFAQVWTPLAFTEANTSRNTHWLISFTGAATGLLKPDVSIEQARVKLGAVADRIARDHPDTNKGWGVVVNAYAAEVVGGDTRQSLYLLMASVLAVLLIGCVNLANLMLTKGLSRHRELSIRLALGASPQHLVRQLLVESLLLSAAGAALGLGVASFAGRALLTALRSLPLDLSLSSRPIPAETIVSLDWRMAAFSAVATLVCVALFGIFPAVRAIRASRLEDAFAGGQRTTANRDQGRLRSLLVVVEMALACVLLVAATLLIRSVGNMTRADIGFDGTRVLTAEMPIGRDRFANADAFLAFLARVQTRVAALPGVQSVGFTSDEPMEPVSEGAFMQIVGRPYQVRAERPTPLLKIVSAAYFPTIELRHQRGRVFDDADRAGAPLVAIVNDTLARMYFDGQDAVGQHVMLNA